MSPTPNILLGDLLSAGNTNAEPKYEWKPDHIANVKNIVPGRTYDAGHASYVNNVMSPALKAYSVEARLLVQHEEPSMRIYDKEIVDGLVVNAAHRKFIEGQLETILAPPEEDEDGEDKEQVAEILEEVAIITPVAAPQLPIRGF